jgi:HJR/Mrr/RecB family endonuclease
MDEPMTETAEGSENVLSEFQDNVEMVMGRIDPNLQADDYNDTLRALALIKTKALRDEARAEAAEDAADEMRAWFRDLETNVASKARAAQLLGRGPVAVPAVVGEDDPDLRP